MNGFMNEQVKLRGNIAGYLQCKGYIDFSSLYLIG